MLVNADHDTVRCVNHPEVEGNFYCSKYARHLCEVCATCADPKLYCKFRPQCIIWELQRYARLR